MNEYLAGMVARSEHELMKQSLVPVLDYDVRVQNQQPGWASKQIGKVFQSVGSVLTALGERIGDEHKHDMSRKTPLSDNC